MEIYIVIMMSFIVPWIIGYNIYKKDKGIILLIAPFSATLSFVLNTPGLDYGYFYPTSINNIKIHTLSIIANAGIFCIIGCLFIFTIRHWNTKLKPKSLFVNIFYTVIGILIDLGLISAGFLNYGNNWGAIHSIAAFIFAFYIIYFYYLSLRKFKYI